ncbi:hypothetical protein [Desulfolutivibrio sulfoxidireducens]|uniref:hypothetical protein n=1 Tax=Desulfolutivibrio sulfoxidireducens TaxID=2773299 RepID=UPI00159D83AB|nr:hypothetical protein [Desulfolutivibrio sulfoxidireducens]QLA18711.1 hypothetical protein GD604_02700 [Desulfolutivibrio sulfoxidireducens]
MTKKTLDPPKPRELDILEMPLSGLAAYWLSLKKIQDTRKGGKIIQEEQAATEEPYIRHLLDIVSSALPEEPVRRLALAKERALLRETGRKLELMSVALLSVARNENPRKTLVAMLSLFPFPPVKEAEVMEAAYQLPERIKRGEVDQAVIADIDHAARPEHLILRLLHYVLTARREGKAAVLPLLKNARSLFFTENWSLLSDGFDPHFMEKRLCAQKRHLLASARHKMRMATEMALGIRNKYAYEDIFRIARSYMVD